METSRVGNGSTMTEQKVREMSESERAQTGLTDTPALNESIDDVLDAAEGRLHIYTKRVTDYAKEHHVDELPGKAKDVLTGTKALVIMGAGAVAVAAGLAAKKWRSVHAEQQQSLRQRVARRIPLVH